MQRILCVPTLEKLIHLTTNLLYCLLFLYLASLLTSQDSTLHVKSWCGLILAPRNKCHTVAVGWYADITMTKAFPDIRGRGTFFFIISILLLFHLTSRTSGAQATCVGEACLPRAPSHSFLHLATVHRQLTSCTHYTFNCSVTKHECLFFLFSRIKILLQIIQVYINVIGDFGGWVGCSE